MDLDISSIQQMIPIMHSNLRQAGQIQLRIFTVFKLICHRCFRIKIYNI